MHRRTLDDAAVRPTVTRTSTPVREAPATSPRERPPTAGSSSSSVTSADDALEQAAVNRLRLYRIAMLCWCVGGIAGTALTPGLVRDKLIAWASVVIFVASYKLRDETVIATATERIRQMFPVAVVQALAALGLNVALGASSPFNALVVVALFLYGLSAPREHARTIFALLAGGYAVLAVLVLAGVIPGTGLLVPQPLPFWARFANAVWVEGTYATGFAVGLYARRDSARLVDELERVVRESAHREALLREAREELARVQKVGGRGPFTGADLGSFRLGDVIGRGGMGEVYTATRRDGAPGEAAVKLLRRDILAQPEMVRRFEREAKIAQSIHSPHIVEVYEVGGEDAQLPYIAMELLHGQDLVTTLRTRPRLELKEIVTLVKEVCDGLRVAHLSGVVHRDLKPANLFLATTEEGACWKILDFGVSKEIASTDATLTTNEVLGTPHYMAPEQALRRPVDARTDLYGLGAITYRALTGKLAFPKMDVSEVIRCVLEDMPEDPRTLADLGEDLGYWLRIAIAKRPDDRFTSAAMMAEAFEAAVRGELDGAWRIRARALLTQQGWGMRKAQSSPPPESATRYR